MILAGRKERALALLAPSKLAASEPGKALAALEPGKALAARSIPLPGRDSLLEPGRLQGGSCASALPPADPAQAESISIPVLWPLKKIARKRVSADCGLSCSFPGQSGLGKSTLINTLFKSKISRKSVQPTSEERIPKTIEIKSITHGEALQIPPGASAFGPALPCVSGDSRGLRTSTKLSLPSV